MNSRPKVALAAVAVIAIGALGLGALRATERPDPGVDNATPRSDQLIWARARLDQDWPAPVRPGGGPIVTMALADDATWDSSRALWDSFEFRDPVGDVAKADVAWVDITGVKLGPGRVTAFALELAGDVPHPQADPADRWIAFGVVQDGDRDGIADVRIGIDNLPLGEHRIWRTDLATGRTESEVQPDGYSTYYPGEGESRNRASLGHWLTFDELVRPFPFYAWASMIEDGRVVATDYAPDTGWLEEGAQPEVRLDGPTWTKEFELTGEGGTFSVGHALAITADGKISFDTGCTTGEGHVTVEPDKLRVSDVVLTERACTGQMAEADATTMAVLGAGDINYDLTRGVLQLRAGEHALQFEADYGPT